jgi:hypothetical protein
MAVEDNNPVNGGAWSSCSDKVSVNKLKRLTLINSRFHQISKSVVDLTNPEPKQL